MSRWAEGTRVLWTPLTGGLTQDAKAPRPLHHGRPKVLGGTRVGAPFPSSRRRSPQRTSDYGSWEAELRPRDLEPVHSDASPCLRRH